MMQKPQPPSSVILMKGATFMVPFWPWGVGFIVIMVCGVLWAK